MNRFTETGSDTPLAVSGGSDWSLAVAPSVELGSRISLGKTAQIRPFARAGVLYERGNDWSHDVRFAQGNADLGDFRSQIALPDFAAQLAGDVEIDATERLSIRAEYGAELASGWSAQSALLRAALKF